MSTLQSCSLILSLFFFLLLRSCLNERHTLPGATNEMTYCYDCRNTSTLCYQYQDEVCVWKANNHGMHGYTVGYIDYTQYINQCNITEYTTNPHQTTAKYAI